MEILLFATQSLARRSSIMLSTFDATQENVDRTWEIMGKFERLALSPKIITNLVF